MGAQRSNEMEGIESLGKHLVKCQEGLGIVSGEEVVYE